MFLSAKTVRLSDCHCILTSQLCSCCQTALHKNVSEASFSSILINKSFMYFSEAGQGWICCTGLAKTICPALCCDLCEQLPESFCLQTWHACFHLTTRIVSGHCVFLSMLWKRTSSSITGQLHTISHLFSDVSWWPDCWTCILITERCALCRPRSWQRTFGCQNTNSPNNHYAGALQGFNKLENWLASVRSQSTRMCIVYFDS